MALVPMHIHDCALTYKIMCKDNLAINVQFTVLEQELKPGKIFSTSTRSTILHGHT
jgi:hypothetical protein